MRGSCARSGCRTERSASWYPRPRQDEIAELRADAKTEVSKYVHDPIVGRGLIAYWAEGAKTPSVVGFANSDPAMIRLFIAWAGIYLDRTPDQMTCRLHLHAGQDEADAIAYWSQVTGIAGDRFGKTFIKPPGTGHRKRVLYRDVATVRLRRGGDLFHRIFGWIDGWSNHVGLHTTPTQPPGPR